MINTISFPNLTDEQLKEILEFAKTDHSVTSQWLRVEKYSSEVPDIFKRTFVYEDGKLIQMNYEYSTPMTMNTPNRHPKPAYNAEWERFNKAVADGIIIPTN